LALEFACGKLHLSAFGGEPWLQRHPWRTPCRFSALSFCFAKTQEIIAAGIRAGAFGGRPTGARHRKSAERSSF
jgi:hypothetical protein